MSRFDYVKYDNVSAEKQSKLKEAFQAVEAFVESSIPDGRVKSLVLTYLEIAYMWTGKAIRDEQIGRGVQVEDVPERTNE
jgi:hypothetical protein